MGVITREVSINAPVATVFEYMADPHNAPEYISSITRIISGPQGTARVGEKWQAAGNFLGQPTTITLRLAELVPHERIRFELLGDPEAVLTTHLHQGPDGDATRAALALDVPSVPQIFLQMVMGGLLTADMQRLKSRLEG